VAAEGQRQRLAVRKTYKLFIGGDFPRSESGRSYPATGQNGEVVARVARASRKDLREAVRSARGAFSGWSGKTAYNRGQVLYRVAELMEGRRDQFVAEVRRAGATDPEAGVDAAIDRWVWYAGWSDKIHHVLGSVNPVAAPYFNFTLPEPTGVVGIVAQPDAPLLGLVSRLAPAAVSGNCVVVLASERWPLPAVTLAEVLATSDVPGGVINILTGFTEELVPWLAGHMDVNALDVTGVPEALRHEVERLCAENVKRIVRAEGPQADWLADTAQSPYAVTAFMEMKTVWHPMGA
jgi:acyl-CoA reductase-like NAD-dependent aldehyde dehydrogenase